jgi:hypothetical protein
LAAKRALIAPAKTDSLRVSLDAMAALVSPGPADLAEERQEHLAMFNLLGDPLLGLRQPKLVAVRAELAASTNIESGQVARVTGRSPIAGKALVELVAPRDELRFQPATRSGAPRNAEAAAECGETYARANDPVWTREIVLTPSGDFSVALPIPSEAHGRCLARVFVSGANDFALGTAEIEVPNAPPIAATPADSRPSIPAAGARRELKSPRR